MKRIQFICAVVGIVNMLGLSACEVNPDINETPTLAEEKSLLYGTDSNVLLVADGDVRLQRLTWDNFYPTSIGTRLHRGDLLRLGEDAVASVLCDDLSLWNVPVGASQGVSNGCPRAENPDILRSGTRLGFVRANSPEIPYILSPRRTNIMNGQPMIRWKELDSVDSYEVSITGLDTPWLQTVDETHVTYPGEPLLIPGEVYKALVVANDGRSSAQETTPDLGFRLLSDDEMTEVATLVERIESLQLAQQARAVALAHLFSSRTYEGWHLTADAIQQIEKLEQQGTMSPNLYLFLGDLYRDVALIWEAQQAYRNALQLAEERNDVAGQADALYELGSLLGNGTCEDRLEAVEHLVRASAHYQDLGDSMRAVEARDLVPANLPLVCPTATPLP